MAVIARQFPSYPWIIMRTFGNLAIVGFLLLVLIGIIFHLIDLLFLLAFIVVPAVAFLYLAWQIYRVRQAGRFFRTLASTIHRGNNHLSTPPDILHYDIEVDRLLREVMAQTATPTQRALVRLFREIKAIGLNEQVRPALEEDPEMRQQIRQANQRILSAVEEQDRYLLFSELGQLYSLYARKSLPDEELSSAPADPTELDERLVELLKSIAKQVYQGRLLGSHGRVSALLRQLVATLPVETSGFPVLLLFWVRSKLLELISTLPEQRESLIWAAENERLARLIYTVAVEYEQGNWDGAVEAICRSYDPTCRPLRFLTPPPG